MFLLLSVSFCLPNPFRHRSDLAIVHFAFHPTELFVFFSPSNQKLDLSNASKDSSDSLKKTKRSNGSFHFPPLAFLSLLDVREDYVIIDPIIKCLDSYRPVRHGKEG